MTATARLNARPRRSTRSASPTGIDTSFGIRPLRAAGSSQPTLADGCLNLWCGSYELRPAVLFALHAAVLGVPARGSAGRECDFRRSRTACREYDLPGVT